MTRFALVALSVTYMIAGPAYPTLAQAPVGARGTNGIGRPNANRPKTTAIPRPSPHTPNAGALGTNRIGESTAVRPNPNTLPSFRPPQTRIWVDTRGRRWMTVDRYVPTWDARQGRWLHRTEREFKAFGTNQIGTSHPPNNVAPGALGGNQVGEKATVGSGLSATSYTGLSATSFTGPSTSLPGTMRGGVQPLFARNLGVYYVPIYYSNGTLGLKLSAAPLPGSPASQLPLDAGDTIFALDGQRFTNPSDVASHYNQTTVEFVDSGTNTRQTGNLNLPARPGLSESPPPADAQPTSMSSNLIGWSTSSGTVQGGVQPIPQPSPARGEMKKQFAQNLGVQFIPIRYNDGTLGLRLASSPVPGSPASQLPLDVGDTIFALDGQRFNNLNDVANHFDQTTLEYVDWGTSTLQSGSINLPSRKP
jgi:hypothetical protein